ncbi:MAG TPA: hypothetical protein VLG68_10830, partial [Gammaproteobacteria bacterium]|nr:hypothetical protein [Gammaproteobacteria bacterium]
MGPTRLGVFCIVAALSAVSAATAGQAAKPLALAKLADVPAEVVSAYRAHGDGATRLADKFDPDPNAFLRGQLDQGLGPEDAALALAIQFGLQQDEAEQLTLALLTTFPSDQQGRFDAATLAAAKATYYRLLAKREDLGYLLVPLGQLLVQRQACGEAPFIALALKKDAGFAVKVFHLTLCPEILAQAAEKFPDDWRIASELAAWEHYGPAGDLALRRETLVLMERANLPATDGRHLLALHDYLDALYRDDLSKQFAEAVAGLDPAARDALLARPPGGGAALIDAYVAALLDLGRTEEAKAAAAQYGAYATACASLKPPCLSAVYLKLLEGEPVAGLMPAYRGGIAAEAPLARDVARRLKAEGRADAGL